MELRACIDVDDLEKGIAFYTRGLGLRVGRRLGRKWAELLGATSPIDLLAEPAGSPASSGSPKKRDYGRHWTPVHLDFMVEDLDAAVAAAVAAGAVLEGEIKERPFGRMANLADPFGHGLCLLQLKGRGYDELFPTEGAAGPAGPGLHRQQ
jgi:catechol 2,3-dioxygenase-like lactoylglutathione lyase family enzyme